MKKLLIILLTIITSPLFATHLVGGEMELTQISYRVWRVRLTLYRDCSGANLCLSSVCTQPIAVRPNTTLNSGCSSMPSQINATLNFVKVEDAELFRKEACPTTGVNGCTNMNTKTPGPFTPSIEKYIFEGILDMNLPTLNQPNTCQFWDVFWEQCCRNSGINNLANSGGTGFRIGNTINIFAANSLLSNNSPRFLNEAVISVCSDQLSVLSHGATDPDGDSLSFEIGNSLNTGGTPVAYQPPFSANFPFPLDINSPPHNSYSPSLNPFVVIDTTTGVLMFTPTSQSTSFIFGNISYYVKEWRRNANGIYQLIGIANRDIQVYVRACATNNIPDIRTNISNNSTPIEFTAFAGDSIGFTVTAFDTDSLISQVMPDTTTIWWDNSLVRPGKLSFNRINTTPRPRQDSWLFSWKTESGDFNERPYQITINARDNNCPNIGYTSRVIKIKVVSKVKLGINKLFGSCNRVVVNITKTDSTNIFSAATLQIANQPNDFTFAGGFRTITSSQPNPTSNQSWRVTGPRRIISDTFFYRQPGKYLVRYFADVPWTNILSNSNSVFYDTVEILNAQPIFSLNDTSICEGGRVTINLPFGNYTWRNASTGSIIGSGSSLLFTPPTSTQIALSGTPSAGTFIGCPLRDTFQVTVHPIPSFSPLGTQWICRNQPTITINHPSVTPPSSSGGISTWTFATRPSAISSSNNNVVLFVDSLPQLPRDTFYHDIATNYATQTRSYVLNLGYVSPVSAGSCVRSDSIRINILPNPTVNAGSDVVICENSAPLLLNSPSQTTPTDTLGLRGLWSQVSGSGLTSITQGGSVRYFMSGKLGNPLKAPQYNELKYTYTIPYSIPSLTDPLSCSNSDAIKAYVVSQPTVNGGVDRTFCSNVSSFKIDSLERPTPAGGKYNTIQGQVVGSFNPITAPRVPLMNKFVYQVIDSFQNVRCISNDTFNYEVVPVAVLQSIIGSDTVLINTTSSFSTQANVNHSYTWQAMGGSVQASNQNTADVLWTMGGANVLQVTASHPACADVSISKSVFVKNPLGIDELIKEEGVVIYPNPANQELNIESRTQGDLIIKMYDATMKEVYMVEMALDSQQGKAVVDLTEMQAGIYFIQVSTGNYSKVYKVSVLK